MAFLPLRACLALCREVVNLICIKVEHNLPSRASEYLMTTVAASSLESDRLVIA